jgi:hypothetical protein
VSIAEESEKSSNPASLSGSSTPKTYSPLAGLVRELKNMQLIAALFFGDIADFHATRSSHPLWRQLSHGGVPPSLAQHREKAGMPMCRSSVSCRSAAGNRA